MQPKPRQAGSAHRSRAKAMATVAGLPAWYRKTAEFLAAAACRPCGALLAGRVTGGSRRWRYLALATAFHCAGGSGRCSAACAEGPDLPPGSGSRRLGCRRQKKPAPHPPSASPFTSLSAHCDPCDSHSLSSIQHPPQRPVTTPTTTSDQPLSLYTRSPYSLTSVGAGIQQPLTARIFGPWIPHPSLPEEACSSR